MRASKKVLVHGQAKGPPKKNPYLKMRKMMSGTKSSTYFGTNAYAYEEDSLVGCKILRLFLLRQFASFWFVDCAVTHLMK
jgi:hypothetical protein